MATVLSGNEQTAIDLAGMYLSEIDAHKAAKAALSEAKQKAEQWEQAARVMAKKLGINFGGADNSVGILGTDWSRDVGRVAMDGPASMDDDVIKELARIFGWPVEAIPCHMGDWDCCGNVGWRVMQIVRVDKRFMARQSWYRDV